MNSERQSRAAGEAQAGNFFRNPALEASRLAGPSPRCGHHVQLWFPGPHLVQATDAVSVLSGGVLLAS